MENLSVIVKQANLDEVKTKSIMESFNGFFEIASEWESKAKEIVVTDENQKDLMKLAREGRLFLKTKRIDVENKRKALKEQSLREGQTIDSIARVLKNLIEPIEEYLETQEKFAEIKEANRKAALEAERIEILKPLNTPYNFYDLKNMSEDDFDSLVLGLLGLKAAINEKIAAQKRAEEERIAIEKAEAEERERVRLENERLRAEAAEREKQIAAERVRIEAERKAAEEKARKEREEVERKLRAEAAERERIEAELKAKKEAEEKAIREAAAKEAELERQKIAAERKAKRAPDKAKLIELSKLVIEIKMPEVKSEEAAKILIDVKGLLIKVHDFIISKTENL